MDKDDHGTAKPALQVTPATADITVLRSRSLTDLPLIQADIVSADAGVADLFIA